MADYVLPQVSVYQDFTTNPSAFAAPLNALIAGGHAQLVRFDQSDERPNGFLGYYDKDLDTDYDWPGREAGGIVDQDYTKLFITDALLKMFQDNSTFTAKSHNKLETASVNLVDYTGFARNASLLRDIRPGDVVKLREITEDAEEQFSTVRAIERVYSTASVPSASYTDGSLSLSTSVTYAKAAGPFNTVDITAASAASYDVYPTGKTHETYTIVVTRSSSGGDFTLAELRVISASGLDDDESVTPSAAGVATSIGALGLTVTFGTPGGTDASDSADAEEISPIDLIAGQKWTVTVQKAYTASVPAATGTYTGPTVDSYADSTVVYLVEVVSGCKFADGQPRITARTTDGSDFSGPTAVPALNTYVNIGTRGVKIKWTSGAGLRLGAQYEVNIAASYPQQARVIVLNDSHGIPEDANVEVTLYIRKPELEINKNRIGYAPSVNFSQSDTQISVKAGILAYDEEWLDNGEMQAMEVHSAESQGWGKVYAHYRAWLSSLSASVGSINDVGQLDTEISGSLHPDNPLKWGVFKALENSNGTDVKFISAADPNDPDSWIPLIDKLVGRVDVYGLVPLTRNRTVLDLFAAHVSDESSPENGSWRVAWFNLQSFPTVPVVHAGSTVPGYTQATTSNGLACLCTVDDDTDTSGTQYTILINNYDNGKFITNGVRPGDIVRFNYTTDGFGGVTYEEYVVDEVLSQNRLRLLSGPATPNVASVRTEIWRTLDANQEAQAIGANAASWGSRRIRCVWPDQIEASGTVMEGYFLCASLAGEASGILPQQGMTNLEITGYSDVSRTTDKFNRAQLNSMAKSGVWIITQSPQTGTIYTRHAVTTGSYDDLNEREEQVTRNVDSISYRFRDTFAPFIGISNVTDGTLDLLRLEITSLTEVLKREKYTPRLGGQIRDITIAELRQHSTLKDHIVCFLNVSLPTPFNNFDLHLVI